MSSGDSFIAEFRIFGTSLGGTELESGWVTFRIDVASGDEFTADAYCYCGSGNVFPCDG